MQPFVLRPWPRAIMHLDADAFFVGVEQALHPALKGKAVITGAERGIVVAASYEAKALGIRRGVSLTEAVHRCPTLLLLPSDYETYNLYSHRMFEIMRRFTPDIEAYSIDEAFADLTGLRRLYREGYQGIAKKIQQTILQELDISVSVGISLSKGLAKLCSKFRKPRGFTAVPGHLIHRLLQRTPLPTVWGFGPNTVALLRKQGCTTALDFALQPRYIIERLLGKTGVEIWLELRGESVHPITTLPKTDYLSISKSKTFAPSSADPAYLFAQVTRNLESACIKARRYHLSATTVSLSLREETFHATGAAISLHRPSNSPLDCLPMFRGLFQQLHRHGRRYRATSVTLGRLQPARPTQGDLFEDGERVRKTDQANIAIDTVNARFGKHTLFLSDGLSLGRTEQAGCPKRARCETDHHPATGAYLVVREDRGVVVQRSRWPFLNSLRQTCCDSGESSA
ncbi:MAG: DNA polymerase IV [Deltaproteobacteria bacterium]|nr:DNA polymerase IV [Deltaproteobacteria bacterium]